jgi:hypothetical protein
MELAGYGFLMLGVAMFIGIATALIIERVREKLDQSGGRDIKQNVRVGDIARQIPVQQREQAQVPTLYNDPSLDLLLNRSMYTAAREYALDKERQAFEAGNEPMVQLYQRYLTQINALPADKR